MTKAASFSSLTAVFDFWMAKSEKKKKYMYMEGLTGFRTFNPPTTQSCQPTWDLFFKGFAVVLRHSVQNENKTILIIMNEKVPKLI